MKSGHVALIHDEPHALDPPATGPDADRIQDTVARLATHDPSLAAALRATWLVTWLVTSLAFLDTALLAAAASSAEGAGLGADAGRDPISGGRKLAAEGRTKAV